jgi:predicted AAA+ superfamily ATPase
VTPPLVAYADLHEDPLVGALLELAANPDSELLAADAARAAMGHELDAATAIALAVIASDGPFASAARTGLAPDDPRLALAGAELARLGTLAHDDARRLLQRHGLEGALAGTTLPPRTRDAMPPAAVALIDALTAGSDWAPHAATLAGFHAREATGDLAIHRVLRWLDGQLVGVGAPDRIALADLTGYDDQRAPLLEDLQAFLRGAPANDALLYGPPGTGKSAAVRACADAFADQGVRLVQVERDQLDDVEEALLALRDGPHAILFLDDLVVDDDDRLDRMLRATLDGGVAERPSNVIVWATSNRLNLMHSSQSERADDVDQAETAGEKSALAARFGRRIRFGRQDRDAYLAICHRLVRDRLGEVPDGLDAEAMRFAVQGHGLSARTAVQFADGYRR